jgi:hypothetical protein
VQYTISLPVTERQQRAILMLQVPQSASQMIFTSNAA